MCGKYQKYRRFWGTVQSNNFIHLLYSVRRLLIAADGHRTLWGSKIFILGNYKGKKLIQYTLHMFIDQLPFPNLCVCISDSRLISSGKFMSMSTKCISFLCNPNWKFIFQNKLIDVFLYGKPEITNFLEQNNVTENLVFTMSVNIKCPLNISNCIEFLNSKSTIKKTKLPYLVLSDFCFFIYFLSLAKAR